MTTSQARRLRSNMTKAEVRLWIRLKALRAEGFHFRRQAPFRGYYLDFACFSRKLAIELDGGHHAEEAQADHDMIRDNVLRREGFTVLRFWNRSLDENMDGVMTTIFRALEDTSPPV